jgi:hypothetical protein
METQNKKEFRIRTVREVLEEVAKGGAKKQEQEAKKESTSCSKKFKDNDTAVFDDSFVWHI